MDAFNELAESIAGELNNRFDSPGTVRVDHPILQAGASVQSDWSVTGTDFVLDVVVQPGQRLRVNLTSPDLHASVFFGSGFLPDSLSFERAARAGKPMVLTNDGELPLRGTLRFVAPDPPAGPAPFTLEATPCPIR